MPIFVTCILFSLAFYLYYRVKAFRSKKANEKKWLSAKATLALGSFVAFFGLNRLFISTTPVSLAVGITFIAVGGIAVWTSYKAYKYYLPHVLEEAGRSKG